MNERIKELLVKAGVKLQTRKPYVDEDPYGYLESDNDFFLNNHEAIIVLLEEGGLEKFAELIVRECVEILSKNNPCPSGTTIMYSLIQDEYFDKGWQVAVETKSNQIKKYFGVEE